MKTQLILISTLLPIASLLNAEKPPLSQELGVQSAIVSNNTQHEFKLSLQFKDPSTNKESFVENLIPANAQANNAVLFLKKRNLLAYKGSKFSVKIVTKVMGIHTDDWAGEFTGENAEFSHTFEYRAVVQNPIKIMSIVHLQMIVNYAQGKLNILFSTPAEDFD